VRFSPGLLAAAHGGVLYVDEVNLLPDHLVDVLLDAAASGRNRVEREGISHEHPCRFVLVGSMNPEEGELRPQLLDRFGLAVDVVASTDPAVRALAVERRLAFDADPEGFSEAFAAEEAALARKLAQAAAARAAPASPLVRLAAALCARVGAEGLRADLVVCRAAAALAALEGEAEAGAEQVRRVAPLALAHRRRRGPFDQPGIDPAELDAALGEALEKLADEAPRAPRGRPEAGESVGAEPSQAGPPRGESEGPSPGHGRRGPQRSATDPALPEAASDPGPAEPTPASDGGPPDPACDPGRPASASSAVPPGSSALVRELLGGPRRTTPAGGAAASGRRDLATGTRGRLVGAKPPAGTLTSVALGATLRAAAARTAQRGGGEAPATGRRTLVAADDVREAVREERVGTLLVLVVDASGSMGAGQRIEAAKGALEQVLLHAYQRRDRVALVTFAGEAADVVLSPTGSVEVARARLGAVRTGGRTPLAAGIRAGLEVARTAARQSRRAVVVVVSDGRATAAPGPGDPLEATMAAAEELRASGVAAVVVDAERGPVRLGLAEALAAAMGARYVALDELTAPALAATLRGVLEEG
jgi:magnesium chelatase subunit D